MPNYLRDLWLAVRRWPIYSGLVAVVLLTFMSSGLASYRLLGDDNESEANELIGPPSAGGHGGTARYYHK